MCSNANTDDAHSLLLLELRPPAPSCRSAAPLACDQRHYLAAEAVC